MMYKVDQLFQASAFTLKIYLLFWTTISNHLFQRVNPYINNNNHFLNKNKKIGKLQDGPILCTMDVFGLYLNIPHGEDIASFLKFLEYRDSKKYRMIL